MKLIPSKTPEIVKTLFPDFVWNINTSQKELYLTFDDGPTPGVTDWVLDQLKTYNAKATFFCIGNNIENHPELFQNIVRQGHSVGNHTYHHLKGWKTKTTDYIDDVLETQNIMVSILKNQESEIGNLFRPPYGKLKSKQSKALQNLGYNIILWDVLSFDWDATVSEETCLKAVLSSAKKGSVIVFHDSKKAQRNLMYALTKVLDYFTEKGFVFKSIRLNN